MIRLLLFAVFVITLPLFSQDNQSEEKEVKEPITEDHHKMNHLVVFAGGTAMLEKKGTYFSLGLDYLRILSTSRNWGAGGFAEIIFAKHPEWVFGGLIYYRLVNQFFIRTGPGIEILRHKEVDPECNCSHVKSETEFLYRIGLGYSYHKESLILSPTIDLDIVRSASALVFGINIGIAF